jgi:hypothetical protein
LAGHIGAFSIQIKHLSAKKTEENIRAGDTLTRRKGPVTVEKIQMSYLTAWN